MGIFIPSQETWDISWNHLSLPCCVCCLTLKVTLFPFNNLAGYSATATTFKILKSLLLLEGASQVFCNLSDVLVSSLLLHLQTTIFQTQHWAEIQFHDFLSTHWEVFFLFVCLFYNLKEKNTSSTLKLVIILHQAIERSKNNHSRSWELITCRYHSVYLEAA